MTLYMTHKPNEANNKPHDIHKPNRFLGLLLLWGLMFCTLNLSAQVSISIGGNVYGGGNEGETDGNTNVTIHTGKFQDIYGGARMADVTGRAFVNIDGEHGSGVILARAIYGGNDISGTVGTQIIAGDAGLDKVPVELTDVLRSGETKEAYPAKNAINNSWVAFVRSSPMRTEGEGTEDDTHCILVGSVYGGGNGDYEYASADNQPQAGKTTHYIYDRSDTNHENPIATKVTDTGEAGFTQPTLTKTYLEINGGCLSQVYGGGNNATVTMNTTISMNNPSKGLQSLFPPASSYSSPEAYRAALMEQLAFLSRYTGISTFQGDYTSLDYTSSRVFGGNNKAEMKIRPVWNLQRGKLRDVYSGGNEGNMTHPEGLILDIKPTAANSDYLSIVNVYGGCRRADVRPTKADGTYPQTQAEIQLPNELGYRFPPGLPARTVVRSGKVTNVYGGNDISGRVFGGNCVGIYTTVYGDVYGGGNGSYSYTDNSELKDLPGFRDFYYDPTEVRDKERVYSGNDDFHFTSGYESVEALNVFRPNAEQVSILVKGTETNPTIIRGSVYLGGNSASLKTENTTIPSGTAPKVELKIGSYCLIDKVFLGNNGANMVTEDILKLYAGSVDPTTGALATSAGAKDFNTMVLTDKTSFAKYMEGCAMSIHPSVKFEGIEDTSDPNRYVNYSSQIGSFFCGGNRGSMTWPGTNTINFNKKVIIFDKFVGGCNNANIEETTYNAEYLGGMIGSPAEQEDGGMLEDPSDPTSPIKDCLILNFSGLKIQPKRWIQDANGDVLDANGNPQLEWNTFDYSTGLNVSTPNTTGTITRTGNPTDFNRRLRGGNIYGGCYESGHMNGNVVINIIDDLVDLTGENAVFDIVTKSDPLLYGNDEYTITERHSGVILDEQGMDPLGLAMNVFGGGYGAASEVWGSATVNLRAGHTFQIFGGGQQGPIGKSQEDQGITSGWPGSDYVYNGKHYKYDARYSTYVNMEDDDHVAAEATGDNFPEIQFIYGGSFEAPIMGNTHVYLGNGRIFNSFAGSCNADILGHTETYVGKGINKDGSATDGQIIDAFPYVVDHIYGGNDLGGRILGEIRAEEYSSAADAHQALLDCDFTERVGTTNGQDLTKVYKYDADNNPNPSVLTASAYIEYTAGHVVNIFGGAYGDYDYTDPKYRAYCNADGSNKDGFSKPRLGNAFVNFKPAVSSNALTGVSEIYGAGQGQHYVKDRDVMQERSYILVDIPQSMTEFQRTVIFGAGAYGGVGMEKTPEQALADPDKVSAIIDLVRGNISEGNVYGGSYKEGVTRRTVVNVPTGSTISVNNIFGGAYGIDKNYPCDVYEAIVNYGSDDAQMVGTIYGGNNNARRTLYGKVNISSPVWTNKTANRTATVFGAGQGGDTWSQYTEVNLLNGASVYEVYGGGRAGKVLNLETVNKWKAEDSTIDFTLSQDPTSLYNTEDGLANAIANFNQLENDIKAGLVNIEESWKSSTASYTKKKYNTNVSIKEGATVAGYCYGAGLGVDAVVSGTSYIDLLGGTVLKDLYGAGTSGAVMDWKKVAKDNNSSNDFIASANVYIKGGSVRNCYGGGWEGPVGYHDESTTTTTDDILGETHVVIGVLGGPCDPDPSLTFTSGIPTVQRNAYGGGEGGVIYGTANITLNNGYIGYVYNASGTDDPDTKDIDEHYEKKIADETYDDGNGAGNNSRLTQAGNIFGSGYADNSNADFTNVYLYGGVARNSAYGGGEIGTVGRGANSSNTVTIHKAGESHLYMYNGKVLQDVFGGGRGFDNLNRMSALGTGGYVFGLTDVNIYGGEIGTTSGVADGFGNVFGGGNLGYVYSGNGTKSVTDGYYYNTSTGLLTEDCRVIVAPACQVSCGESITLNGHDYAAGQYVPAEDLNFLKNKNSGGDNWNKLNVNGVTIRNAVFAGGNVSSGSDQVYANTVTVYGNATATLYDIYNRDLITIGTEHVGGLYGDGNLTFVDGYRELNVSNYGTDFYGLSDNISLDDYYNKLTDRERAYFELEYKCLEGGYYSSVLGKTVSTGERIKEDDYNKMTAEEQAKWELGGFCTIYAGRLLNTLQRADFVGVFGSRMVLQGAQDRVPEVVDYTNYTINRVGELSLNKCTSQAGDTGDAAEHGCYFGIYSIVNYLGALTSDVDFSSVRTTDQSDSQYQPDSDGQTYQEWKELHLKERKRNNGTSHNKVALASGVYLELTTEESTKDNKVWGPITGVCQLDLINVMTGLGGGYVYAKNEHGTRTSSGNNQTILSPYNMAGYGHARAVTNKIYQYSESESDLKSYETSGNFIHNTKQIIDDCYPTSGSYSGTNPAPAHYWYIRGEIYVYDQIISAYTGSASAYQESINLPLTITPASNGMLKLSDVKENLYAYWKTTTAGSETPIGEDGILIGTTTYYLNDPITYWDWYLLSAEDRKHFVKETYVSTAECTLADGTTVVPEGTVLLPAQYDTWKAANANVTAPSLDATNTVPFDDVFHLSNNVSHSTGYALTYDMTNPKVWDRYYTPPTGASLADNVAGKVTTAVYSDDQSTYGSYIGAPTYTPTTSGVYGQREYEVGDIIPNDIYTKYVAIGTGGYSYPSDQATVARAYVATDEVTYTIGTGSEAVEHHVYMGYAISGDEYNQLSASAKAKFAAASVCTSTIELGNNEFVFYGDLLTADEITANKAKYRDFLASQGIDPSLIDAKVDADFAAFVSDAWYCTGAGKYGGDYYESSKNYRALEAWSSMSETDRANFTFNYDAFDTLIDPNFSGDTGKYDGNEGNNILQELYSEITPVDYTATYNGQTDLTYTKADGTTTVIIHEGDVLQREAYEAIPNERRHYQSMSIPDAGTYYIVKVPFSRGDVPYTVGTVISTDTYVDLDAGQKQNVMTQTFSAGGIYYFCRKSYHINERGEGYAVTDIAGTSHALNSEVTVGTIITESEFENLPNKQTNFTIHGTVPIGTSSLYVSRESDINDLSEEKVVTVIYEYTYEESDESGMHIEQITEKHVINIHLQFKSGVPTISELEKPAIVLPNNSVGLKQPNVTPGAFEIIGGGWEMFTNQSDAEHHTNGIPYFNNLTPLYWYQNDYYVAYYAKSYLGKTYSNAVQFTVANYHDLDAVMNHSRHMFVDHEDVSRPCKIYIDNRECTNASKSELDLLKDFFDLTLHNETDLDGNPETISGGTLDGHKTVDSHIRGGANLEFFLKSDVSPKEYTTNWTPIGNNTQCFEGVFHGNGFTISGLDNSLFGSLCGDVYNLGVTGSFTSAGIVDTGSGYVENCWINTTGTPASGVHAVFNNPTRSDPNKPVQIVNCYYPADNAYTETAHSDNHGDAIKKPRQSFYNGEVAYNLNGFYLNKRYNDHLNPRPTGYSADGEPQHPWYYYWDADDLDSSNKPKFKQGGYEAETDYTLGYVEKYYEDGDFIYAGGYIPEGDNERYSTTYGKHYPIWPDDYLFFGQMLTYGHVESRPHQNLPAHVNKSSDRLTTAASSVNRVYRAPAYFQSKNMGVAYYNPYAVFAAKSKDNTHTAYPNMTAIDFTGGNDDLAGGYRKGLVEISSGAAANTKQFYPPLIDNDGLTFFRNVDLTRNLLAYTPNTDGNSNHAKTKTYTAVMAALADPVFTETNTNTYRTVAAQDISVIHGHAVVETASNTYTATNDHLLVDKEDFNAPIAYTFNSGKRMWYQRRPDTYVDRATGWEGISIPFSAELVTTQRKGEITHFYSGSEVSKNETNTKIGHEYWLREFMDGGAVDGTNSNIFRANFNYPDALTGGEDKVYTNTFLWDFYYKDGNSPRLDNNTDTYQQSYYATSHTYEDYAYSAVAKPYIIGFPGTTYYEFDLSGGFGPDDTPATNLTMTKQVITFASRTGISIAVSDDEIQGAKVTEDNYTFWPNYLSKNVDAGAYMLNSTGSSFDVTAAATAGVPFRPYFTAASGTPVKEFKDIESIAFTRASASLGGGEEESEPDEYLDGELTIYSRLGRIVVKSGLNEETTVRIVNAGGALISVFTIQPGETVTTPVPRGIYIVNKKKLSVGRRI